MSGVANFALIAEGGKSLMNFALKPFMPQAPEVPQAPDAPAPVKGDGTGSSPEIQAAVDQQRKHLRASRGRKSTILTGESTLGEPTTKRKTILGG